MENTWCYFYKHNLVRMNFCNHVPSFAKVHYSLHHSLIDVDETLDAKLTLWASLSMWLLLNDKNSFDYDTFEWEDKHIQACKCHEIVIKKLFIMRFMQT